MPNFLNLEFLSNKNHFIENKDSFIENKDSFIKNTFLQNVLSLLGVMHTNSIHCSLMISRVLGYFQTF